MSSNKKSIHSNHKRSAYPQRRPHVIHFGHPYSCTPILETIFESNKSPNHKQVSCIMAQTGLKRKQITSWFWRKRKELLEMKKNGLDGHQKSSNQLSTSGHQLLAPNHAKKSKPVWFSRTKQDQDPKYRPSGITKKTFKTNKRSTGAELRSSVEPILLGSRRNFPDNRTSARMTSSSDIATPISSVNLLEQPIPTISLVKNHQRSPLLIRCKLRPFEQEVGSSHSTQSDYHIRELNKPIHLDNVKSQAIPLDPLLENEMREASLGNQDLSYCSLSGIYSQWTSNSCTSTVDSLSSPTFRLCHNQYVIPETENFYDSSSLTTSPERVDYNRLDDNQYAIPKTENFYDSSSLTTSPERVDYNRLDGNQYTFQVNQQVKLEDYVTPPSNRMIDPENSNHKQNSRTIFQYQPDSSPEIFFSSSNHSLNWSVKNEEESEPVGFQQERLEYDQAHSLVPIGYEVHRWSELSDIDGASRYSSKSIESLLANGVNQPTTLEYSSFLNVNEQSRTIDYSCLLNSSENQVMLSQPATPNYAGLSMSIDKNNNDDRLEESRRCFMEMKRSPSWMTTDDECGRRNKNELIKQVIESCDGQNNLFSFHGNLLNQDFAVEEDPRLFMWERQGAGSETNELLRDWKDLFKSHTVPVQYSSYTTHLHTALQQPSFCFVLLTHFKSSQNLVSHNGHSSGLVLVLKSTILYQATSISTSNKLLSSFHLIKIKV
ncbi:hypothetical protein O181_028372 [Austropuccinia psidii MF-1]|uniref:Homeobox domain-containing protein n=1 Tax=Austropuccinia psidii MF-1 TaxID=1389203 RepID=A0A9Q3CUF7_9BASI|nr:hypothetical protein [Austropuccinia psidii MF-1]